MEYILKNGTVVTAEGTEKTDLYIRDGKIEKIGKGLSRPCETIDVKGLHIFPGFIDMHTHLREPGFDYKEDIASGGAAAVAGGFTQIACMPNTNPVCDNNVVVRYILSRAAEVGLCKILPIGAVTKGQNGEELAAIGFMKQAGIVALSDDGRPVPSAKIMRLAMEYASDFDLMVLSHCEEKTLSEDGVVNEGYYATLTGLKGIPRSAEEIMVAREINLAETLNKRIHLCHVSTKGSIQLVREAKARGVSVSCETCPHYFSATDALIQSYDPMTKVNPPLREESDRIAVIQGLLDGTIDAIATDHAPHHKDEKNIEYSLAAFGISGLETAFALSYTVLVKENKMPLPQLARLLSKNPASLFRIPGGEIREGETADLTVCDLQKEWTVDSEKFYSKGKNTPFDGKKLTGEVQYTVVDGKIVFKK